MRFPWIEFSCLLENTLEGRIICKDTNSLVSKTNCMMCRPRESCREMEVVVITLGTRGREVEQRGSRMTRKTPQLRRRNSGHPILASEHPVTRSYLQIKKGASYDHRARQGAKSSARFVWPACRQESHATTAVQSKAGFCALGGKQICDFEARG